MITIVNPVYNMDYICKVSYKSPQIGSIVAVSHTRGASITQKNIVNFELYRIPNLLNDKYNTIEFESKQLPQHICKRTNTFDNNYDWYLEM